MINPIRTTQRNMMLVMAISAFSASVSAAGLPQDLNEATRRPPQPAAHGPTLASSLEAARAAIDACSAKGQAIGVSVVDSAGVLKVLLATDGASERGVLSSTNKAVTALHFKTATSRLFERIDTDTELAEKIAANPSYNGRPGGVLLKDNEAIIGAIGVGGARIDEECALAGIDNIKPQTNER